jgi:small-conductance mechanosensitive channel
MDHRFSLTRPELDAITALVWLLIAVAVGLVVHKVLCWTLTRWAERANNPFVAAVVRRTQRPASYVLPLLAILIVFPNLVLPAAWTRPAIHLAGLLTIAGVAWSAIAMIRLWGDVVIARHRIDVEDNLLARQLGTRVDILSRVGVTIVVIVAVGMMLMTFPSIRALGTTLLASAGLAGIVVGLAARPLFENLVAGIQLALTQPMRIDDVVVVEKQFGRIEEIHTTYVVVRLWDLRRLVVPLAYFINTPFENWTRRTANVIGEVYFFADYTVDVEAIRAELPRILKDQKLWDGQVQAVQVTDATEKSVQIRALVSARDSAALFDLRCIVREALIRFLREQQAQALPVERTLQRNDPGPAAPETPPQTRVRVSETANGNGTAVRADEAAPRPSSW